MNVKPPAKTKHYPCLCHDWVWRNGAWVFVPRPDHVEAV